MKPKNKPKLQNLQNDLKATIEKFKRLYSSIDLIPNSDLDTLNSKVKEFNLLNKEHTKRFFLKPSTDGQELELIETEKGKIASLGKSFWTAKNCRIFAEYVISDKSLQEIAEESKLNLSDVHKTIQTKEFHSALSRIQSKFEEEIAHEKARIGKIIMSDMLDLWKHKKDKIDGNTLIKILASIGLLGSPPETKTKLIEKFTGPQREISLEGVQRVIKLIQKNPQITQHESAKPR